MPAPSGSQTRSSWDGDTTTRSESTTGFLVVGSDEEQTSAADLTEEELIARFGALFSREQRLTAVQRDQDGGSQEQILDGILELASVGAAAGSTRTDGTARGGGRQLPTSASSDQRNARRARCGQQPGAAAVSGHPQARGSTGQSNSSSSADGAEQHIQRHKYVARCARLAALATPALR